MKKFFKFFSIPIFILIFCLFSTNVRATTRNAATDFFNDAIGNVKLGNSNGVGQFTLTWIAGKTGTTNVLDSEKNNLLLLNPPENSIYNAESNTSGGVKATYQMIFNMGGSKEAEPGEIQIKLPKYLFYGRDDKPITDQILEIPLAAYPENKGTGFNYRFETDENGEEFIILENYQKIPASYSFECSITYILPTPSTVADGYTKEFTADATVDFDSDGVIDLESNSNPLELKYSSHATINSVSASYSTHRDSDSGLSVNVYQTWPSDWPTSLKPENADDYVYAIWYTTGSVYYATQPYRFKIKSESIDAFEGEVLGVGYNYNYNYFTYSNYVTAGDIYTTDYLDKPSNTSNGWFYYPTIVKYPKLILNDGETHTLEHKFTWNLEGKDGALDEKSAIVSIDYKRTFRTKNLCNW